MDHQRRGAVPAAHEPEQILDMARVRRHMAVERLADIVHAQDEMVALRHAGRAFEVIVDAEQGDDVARPGGLHRGMEPREGADVDHGCRILMLPTIIRKGGGIFTLARSC